MILTYVSVIYLFSVQVLEQTRHVKWVWKERGLEILQSSRYSTWNELIQRLYTSVTTPTSYQPDLNLNHI